MIVADANPARRTFSKHQPFFAMPRLRISDGVSDWLIPWYSVLEVHVDSTFRLFELYLAGDVVCRIISRRPQEGLYADLQQERVKVIYPVANVSVKFEDMKK